MTKTKALNPTSHHFLEISNAKLPMDSLTRGALVYGENSLFVNFSPLSSSRVAQRAPSCLRFSLSEASNPSRSRVKFRVSSSSNQEGGRHDVIRKIRSTTRTVILTAVAALMIGKFSKFPARAESPATLTEEKASFEDEADETEVHKLQQNEEQENNKKSLLSQFLESHTEAIDALKSLLQQKLDEGDDKVALIILKRLVAAQPSKLEWKFLMARLLNEMGETSEARKVFEDILTVNPLSFEALFENAILMDRCGEGEAVLQRLEEALKIAQEEHKEKEARDVRLIMAQIQYLQKNIDEALGSYQELAKEDPTDLRPYFCQGVIYSFLDRNKEAREQFAKYHELSSKKFEVEGFLQTPLSRMKLFGTDSGT